LLAVAASGGAAFDDIQLAWSRAAFRAVALTASEDDARSSPQPRQSAASVKSAFYYFCLTAHFAILNADR
jgi:hypothetical protein